jgi:hypothetical protein
MPHTKTVLEIVKSIEINLSRLDSTANIKQNDLNTVFASVANQPSSDFQ